MLLLLLRGLRKALGMVEPGLLGDAAGAAAGAALLGVGGGGVGEVVAAVAGAAFGIFAAAAAWLSAARFEAGGMIEGG